ncbi:MAG: hypothetical protein ACLP7J_22010 [Streptosporangiaceae bacterium]
MPVGAAATGGGLAAASGVSAVWIIVAGATLLVACLAAMSLMPRLRRRGSRI